MNIENTIIEARQALRDSAGGIYRNPNSNRLFINNRCIRSVTELISSFCPFDANAVAARVAANPSHPLYQKSIDEIKAIWHDKAVAAGKEGTQAHVVAHQLYRAATGEPVAVNAVTPKEQAIQKFWAKITEEGYLPVASEQIIYNPLLWYAGIFDLLMFNPQEMTFELFDFKTTEDFHKSFKEHMTMPMDFLKSDYQGKATLQLNLYAMQLANIGIDVRKMSVIWAKEDGDFESIQIEDWAEAIHEVLAPKTQRCFYGCQRFLR